MFIFEVNLFKIFFILSLAIRCNTDAFIAPSPLNNGGSRTVTLSSETLHTNHCDSFKERLLIETTISRYHINKKASDFTSTCLFSSKRNDGSNNKQQRRVARRDLKKRPNRRKTRKGQISFQQEQQQKDEFDFWKTSEKRPLIRSERIESGEDYWIDEKDLIKAFEQEKAVRNRKAMEGEMPKEKLRADVVAPYKQNWIGYFSVFIIIIATIIDQFPELLQTPVIPIPDL